MKSTGSDLNPCSLTQPCRSFQKAVNTADPRGEVIALDTSLYGAFSVGKAVSVIAPPGVHAVVNAVAGRAVEVAAGSSDDVVLRGLTLIGRGASIGVSITSGGSVHVEQCTLSHLATGISMSHGMGRLFVVDTVVQDAVDDGILAVTGSGIARVVVERSRFEGGTCAVAALHGSAMVVRDSEASGARFAGFCVNANNGASPAEIVLEGVTAAHSRFGIWCNGNAAFTRVGGSAFAFNTDTGMAQQAGCTFLSMGNNLVDGNIVNTSGTITPLGGL